MRKIGRLSSKLGFSVAKELYREVLTSVEKNHCDWSNMSEFDRFENDLRFEHMNTGSGKIQTDSSTKNRKSPDTVWCREYNQGTCTHSGAHVGKFFGQTVKKLHVCSSCLKKDNKRMNHKATDQECPHLE